MKKLIFILFIIAIGLTSCRYEDGPLISFKSPDKRLTEHTWTIEKFTVNGDDSTDFYIANCGRNVVFYFDRNVSPHTLVKNCNCDDFNPFLSNSIGDWGTYVFTDDKKNLKVAYYDPSIMPFVFEPATINWQILKLTSSEFWISTNYNNKEYVLKVKET